MAVSRATHPRLALRHRVRRGFTLIEASLATVIVGVGVLSMMQLLVVCTQQNKGSSQLTTAMYLAQCIQEATSDLPFNDPSGAGFGREEGGGLLTWNDIDDFSGFDSNANGAPIDAQRQSITDLARYSQVVTCTEVSPNNLSLSLTGADCKRMTVVIMYRQKPTDPGTEIYRMSWIRSR